jgi:hypothetical protein
MAFSLRRVTVNRQDDTGRMMVTATQYNGSASVKQFREHCMRIGDSLLIDDDQAYIFAGYRGTWLLRSLNDQLLV